MHNIANYLQELCDQQDGSTLGQSPNSTQLSLACPAPSWWAPSPCASQSQAVGRSYSPTYRVYLSSTNIIFLLEVLRRQALHHSSFRFFEKGSLYSPQQPWTQVLPTFASQRAYNHHAWLNSPIFFINVLLVCMFFLPCTFSFYDHSTPSLLCTGTASLITLVLQDLHGTQKY